MRRRKLILVFLFSSIAQADYAWIPEYQRIQLRTGMDFYSSSNNYDTNSFLVPLAGGTFSDHIFWVEPEYGIAEDWSAGLRLPFPNAVLGAMGSPVVSASGAGVGDLRGSVKWRLFARPLWTLEGVFKLPTGSSQPTAPNDIVDGEGNLDLGLKVHYGYQVNTFYFSVSPGVLARFGGYATALTAEAAAQGFFNRAYTKVFFTSIVALAAQALPPSTIAAQTLAGTGGSYARLAASPIGVAIGVTVGVLLTRNFRLDGTLVRSIDGIRYPEFLNFSLSLQAVFDFSKPDLRPKLREVPFEGGS